VHFFHIEFHDMTCFLFNTVLVKRQYLLVEFSAYGQLDAGYHFPRSIYIYSRFLHSVVQSSENRIPDVSTKAI
jgi:hypothetical protein